MSSESAPTNGSAAASALDEARRLGRTAAAAFDQQLRLDEGRHREQRLTALAWFGDARDDADDSLPSTDGYEMAKLRRRVEEQDYLLDAIENSTPWRLIQRVRGWFGRSW